MLKVLEDFNEGCLYRIAALTRYSHIYSLPSGWKIGVSFFYCRKKGPACVTALVSVMLV